MGIQVLDLDGIVARHRAAGDCRQLFFACPAQKAECGSR